MIYNDLLDVGALEQYAAAMNARASRIGTKGRLSAADLRDRILRSGGRCEWCAVNLVGAEFELDHVLSLKQGGANAAENLVVACPGCNRRKGRKHPARFAAEIHRRTGRETQLTASLFQRYGIEKARQGSLFDRDSQPPSSAAGAPVAIDEIPPYTWVD